MTDTLTVHEVLQAMLLHWDREVFRGRLGVDVVLFNCWCAGAKAPPLDAICTLINMATEMGDTGIAFVTALKPYRDVLTQIHNRRHL
jgi:hypothetical protein